MQASVASNGSSDANANNAKIGGGATATRTDEQIVSQFYLKAAQVVVGARVVPPQPVPGQPGTFTAGNPTGNPAGKRNKWFNLDTLELEPLRSEVKYWRALVQQTFVSMPGLGPVSAHASAGRHATATSTAAPPSAPASTPSPQPSIQPMIIDIYLDLPTSEPILVLKDEATLRRHRFPKDALLGLALDPITGTQFGVKKKRILLESWHLSLMPHSPSNTPSIDVAVMYKRMVAFFRSLYAFVRLLPSYKHFKRHSAFHSSQAPNPSSNPAVSTSPPSRQFPNQLKVGYRLASSRVMPVDEAGLDQLHVPGRTADTHLGIAEYSFSPLETTIGKLNLHVMYRVECDFSISDPEPPLMQAGTSSKFGTSASSGSSAMIAGMDLDNNYYSRSPHDSSFSSPFKQHRQSFSNPSGDETAAGYTPPSLSSSRRVSVPISSRSNSNSAGPFAASLSQRPSQTLLGSSPRSLGAAGTRQTLPGYPMARAMGPPSVSGSSSLGRTHGLAVVAGAGTGSAASGVSPAFTLSGSFPRSYGAAGAGAGSAAGGGGFTDAVAMGLFDGVQGLPFSVSRRSEEAEDGRRSQGLDSDRKSLEDVFLGLEESPPFNVFINRDLTKYPRSGTSLSSNQSVGSNTSLSHRHSMTFPRYTDRPFTTTILHDTPVAVPAPPVSPSSLTSTTGALIQKHGNTPPLRTGHSFTSSITNLHPFATHALANTQTSSAASGSSRFLSSQSPPPFVTMKNLSRTGSDGGVRSALQVQQVQAATIANELGEFLRGVDGKRKSLVIRHKSSNGGLDGSDVSLTTGKRRVSKAAALARYQQLKDSYSEFSNSLVAATSTSPGSAPKLIASRGSTPPPVVFSNSPPASSPKLRHMASFDAPVLPSQELLSRSPPKSTPGGIAVPQYRPVSEKVQMRKPSSLQFATVLSTVLSESGGDESSSGGSTGIQSSVAVAPSGSPILEEFGRDQKPRQPPGAVAVPSVVLAPADPSTWMRSRPISKNVYTADNPARVSSGFFPASRSESAPSSSEGDRSISPALAIKSVDSPLQALGGLALMINSSSLSTSLRSACSVPGTSHTIATAPLAIPAVPRAISEERPNAAASVAPLPRRNSSGGLLAAGTGASPVTISESGAANRIGKHLPFNSRFGSAPVEVPFAARRNISDRARGAIDGGDGDWNLEDDDD